MNYIEWVDAYLAGELPEAQRKEFEAALAESAELQAEVSFTRRMMAALSVGPPDEVTENLIDKIAEQHRSERNALFQEYRNGKISDAERVKFEKQLEENELFAFEWEMYQKNNPALKAKKMQIKWMRWVAAASVVLLIGFFSWWMMKGGENNEELLVKYDVPELFPRTEYALVDDGLLHKSIVGSEEFEQTKLDGLQAFDAKDWHLAIRLLTEYQQNTKPSAEDMPDEINLLGLYIGRAWYEQKKPRESVVALQTCVESVVDTINYRYLQELMRWHLALAHLQNHDPAAAKTQLKILRNAHQKDIREQAEKLLSDLK